jgi:2-polyprenyl-3-methyl-5-hydroxy-6-metoxy-1,4-benzoquinol methylase
MLSKRFKYNGKSVLKLNEIQIRMKDQIEKKIGKGIYSFEEVPCCICSGKNFDILAEKDRYGLYTSIVICRNCGLIQANPRMRQKSYNQFYNIEYRKLYVGKETPTEYFFRNQYYRGKRIYHYLENNLGTSLTNLRILEVGSGAGGILYYFKEMGNEVCGCDLGSEYIEFGKEKYGLNLFIGTIDDIKESQNFNIVIYSHVLEHIPNPISELNKLKSFIDKNSYIYIELPGVKYLTNSYNMNFLRQIQNAHVYYFTLTTLENVLGQVGYDLVSGNEIINSIFKLSSKNNGNYRSDYDTTISFLRKMEFYRFLPTLYNFKRLVIPGIISFLKHIGLYNMAKRIYHKFK